MADNSKIEWCDATWNIVTGCTLVSEGCRHCYAALLAATRLKHHPSRKGLARVNAAGEAKFTGEVRFNEQWLDQPLRWRRPRRIFVCAHGDLFHESVPDGWIDKVFGVMSLATQHQFQVLTKRPERMRAYFEALHMRDNEWDRIADSAHNLAYAVRGYRGSAGQCARPLRNVWLGTSCEDQATADERIPHLLQTPAAVRFLSLEPLLGSIDLESVECMPGHRVDVLRRGYWNEEGYRFGGRSAALGAPRGGFTNHSDMAGIDLVIVGGESGPHARPMHPSWPRSIRDQCLAAGVPFHFKQWGAWRPSVPHEAGLRTIMGGNGHARSQGAESLYDDDMVLTCIGKKAAGRQLDGRTWDGMPRHG